MTEMSNTEFKKCRSKLGLTQGGLVNATGISKRQIVYYESGEQAIKKQTALLMRLLVKASKKTLREVGF